MKINKEKDKWKDNKNIEIYKRQIYLQNQLLKEKKIKYTKLKEEEYLYSNKLEKENKNNKERKYNNRAKENKNKKFV